MNTRCLIPMITVFVACLMPGCVGYDVSLGDEQPKTNELPQAPAPRAKKSNAELLVGKWTRVKFLGKPLPPGNEVLLEFTADGKFKFVTTIPALGAQVKTGVYRVMGETIRVTSDPTPDEPSRTWDITIESISETELATTSGPLNERERNVSKRVEMKK